MSASRTTRDAHFQRGELGQQAEERPHGKKALGPGEMSAQEALHLIHDLQARQAELEMQNEALLQAFAEKEKIFDKYSDFFDFAPIGYFLWDSHGKILEINRASAAMINIARESALNVPFGTFIVSKDRQVFADFLDRVFAGKEKQTCEVKLTNSGNPIDVLIEGAAAADRGGEVIFCRAAVIDITDRKRADEPAAANRSFEAEVAARKRAEAAVSSSVIEAQDRAEVARAAAEAVEHLSRFPEEDPNPVLRIAYDGTILYANAASRPLLACWNLAQGQTLPEDWQKALAAMIDAGKPLEREIDCGGKTCSCLLVPFPAEGYVNVYGTDITARKRAEAELKAAHDAVATEKNRLEAVMETLPVGVAIIDAKGGNVRSNDTFHKVWGGPLPQTNSVADYAQFKAWWVTSGEPVLPPEWASAQAVQKGETVVGQLMQIKRFDGRRAFVLNSAAPILDHNGYIVGSAVAILDITDLKLAEERLRLHSQVASELLASDNPQQIVDFLCRRVMDHLDCHVFFNFLADEEHNRLRLNAYAGVSEETARQIEFLDMGTSVCGCVAQDGRRIVAQHIQSTPDPRAELVRSFGIQAYACHPLVGQGKVIGTLSFGSKTKPTFTEDELGVMKTVADHVAVAMQRIRMMESLERHAKAAEAANRTKSQFFANVSHDLRTPMNAILGMTELALAETTDSKVKDFLETVKESAVILLELLNEVLALSRMESGKLQLDALPFSLRRTLAQTVKTLEIRASEKGLDLVCNLPDDVPDRLLGDPLRLRQILMNLLGNAIKFTEKGGVTLSAKIQGSGFGVQDSHLAPAEYTAVPVAKGCSGGAPSAFSRDPKGSAPSPGPEDIILEFLDADTGMGIPPEDQKRIFEPFTQADASTSRVYGGTGLGLTIAAGLVQMMGGRIWVESQPGAGSKFYFTAGFRLQTATAAELLAAESLSAGEIPLAVEPLRILLAEDNPANQKLAVYILNKHGHRVKIAQDGREALERVCREDFDVVLMDVQMLGMDGFQTTAAIRALPDQAKARLPIIAMTAYAMKEDRQRCLDAGMNGYIAKPIDAGELIALVHRLGAKHRGHRRETAPSAPAHNRSPDASASPVFNLGEAVERCFRKYELFQDMAECLFDESDSLLREMHKALENGDAQELGHAAHRLKGTVVFLGAPLAAEAARRVEQIGLSGELDTRCAEAIDQLQRQIDLLKAALAPHRKNAK